MSSINQSTESTVFSYKFNQDLYLLFLCRNTEWIDKLYNQIIKVEDFLVLKLIYAYSTLKWSMLILYFHGEHLLKINSEKDLYLKQDTVFQRMLWSHIKYNRISSFFFLCRHATSFHNSFSKIKTREKESNIFHTHPHSPCAECQYCHWCVKSSLFFFVLCFVFYIYIYIYSKKKREKKPKESSSLIHRKNMKNSLFFHQVHIHIYHI